jgi:hypothetical protein
MLEKRGGRNPYDWKLTSGYIISQLSRTYPDPNGYMRRLRERLTVLTTRWVQMRSQSCGDPSLRPTDFQNQNQAPAGGQVEHPLPVRLQQP